MIARLARWWARRPQPGGGRITGPAHRPDDVPALLSPGGPVASLADEDIPTPARSGPWHRELPVQPPTWAEVYEAAPQLAHRVRTCRRCGRPQSPNRSGEHWTPTWVHTGRDGEWWWRPGLLGTRDCGDARRVGKAND